MPKFHSDPNKYKKAIDDNITPTKKPRIFSWILIFVLFFVIVFISILSKSNTSRVIQTESRKLTDGIIFEMIGQNELYMGNYISYKITLSSDTFKKVRLRSFDTYIVYKGKKVFEYPSKNYPGPDTVSTTLDGQKSKLIFSNSSFAYYPSQEGTYTIVADSYINDKFVELKKNVNVLHKSPLNLFSNAFFFPGQSISGEIYINNPYPVIKTFKIYDVKLSIDGKSRKKIIDDSFTLTSGGNAKVLNIEDLTPPIIINKTGTYLLTLSSLINNRLENIQYPINIINRNELSSSDGMKLDISSNKYFYSINDPFWFDAFVVNDSQETKYFKINSCSAIIEYKDTVIKSVNIPINRNLILRPFERFKLFSSRKWWNNFNVLNPYNIIFKIDFSGKDNKKISKEYKIKIQD